MSRTSERAGYTLTALPSEGYRKRAPGLNAFLPRPTARHRAVWAELWSTPQACAWSLERWRWPVVADLCRRMVDSEHPATPIAVTTAIRQLRDDLGLSSAGLKQHGWAIAKDEIAARRQNQEQPPVAPHTGTKPQRRLRDASAQR